MRDISLALVGDINLKRDLQLRAERAFQLVDDEVARADVRMGNLEGAFFDPSIELEYKRGWFHLEPQMATALKGRFDALGCANNVHHGAAIPSSLAISADCRRPDGNSGRARGRRRAHFQCDRGPLPRTWH